MAGNTKKVLLLEDKVYYIVVALFSRRMKNSQRSYTIYENKRFFTSPKGANLAFQEEVNIFNKVFSLDGSSLKDNYEYNGGYVSLLKAKTNLYGEILSEIYSKPILYQNVGDKK